MHRGGAGTDAIAARRHQETQDRLMQSTQQSFDDPTSVTVAQPLAKAYNAFSCLQVRPSSQLRSRSLAANRCAQTCSSGVQNSIPHTCGLLSTRDALHFAGIYNAFSLQCVGFFGGCHATDGGHHLCGKVNGIYKPNFAAQYGQLTSSLRIL